MAKRVDMPSSKLEASALSPWRATSASDPVASPSREARHAANARPRSTASRISAELIPLRPPITSEPAGRATKSCMSILSMSGPPMCDW